MGKRPIHFRHVYYELMMLVMLHPKAAVILGANWDIWM